MSIGQNIKSRRRTLDMTLEELAQKVGVSRQTLSRYETGVIGNIPYDKILAISAALDISPGCIMGWIDENGNPLPPYELTPDDYLEIIEEANLAEANRRSQNNLSREQLSDIHILIDAYLSNDAQLRPILDGVIKIARDRDIAAQF